MRRRDDIDRFLEYGLDVPNRIIKMSGSSEEGDVDHSMASDFIKNMSVLATINTEPITIIMNNPGGDWYHGMAIYDFIKDCPCEVTIIVYGYAMSMGSIILQAADRRFMSQHSSLMIHYGMSGEYAHTLDFIKTADQTKKLNKTMEDIYLKKIRQKHPKFTRKALQEKIKFDFYLTPRECLRLGLIDGIIGDIEELKY